MFSQSVNFFLTSIIFSLLNYETRAKKYFQKSDAGKNIYESAHKYRCAVFHKNINIFIKYF